MDKSEKTITSLSKKIRIITKTISIIAIICGVIIYCYGLTQILNNKRIAAKKAEEHQRVVEYYTDKNIKLRGETAEDIGIVLFLTGAIGSLPLLALSELLENSEKSKELAKANYELTKKLVTEKRDNDYKSL